MILSELPLNEYLWNASVHRNIEIILVYEYMWPIKTSYQLMFNNIKVHVITAKLCYCSVVKYLIESQICWQWARWSIVSVSGIHFENTFFFFVLFEFYWMCFRSISWAFNICLTVWEFPVTRRHLTMATTLAADSSFLSHIRNTWYPVT